MTRWVVGIILVLRSLEGLAGQPRFQQWGPVRKGIRHDSSVVQDIFSHADRDYLGKYNFLTAVHETQHYSTSMARSWAFRNNPNIVDALYCLDGNVVVFEVKPKIRLSRVAASTPISLRGGVWGLYVTSRDWDDCPTYLFNEWLAYTHEVMVRAELGMTQDPSSLTYGTELMVYSCLYSSLEPDNQEVADFISWNAPRSLALTRGHAGSREFLSRLDRPENAKIKAHMVFRLGLDILDP